MRGSPDKAGRPTQSQPATVKENKGLNKIGITPILFIEPEKSVHHKNN